MLAAHRHGGRTNLLAFARAWDRFCHAKRPRTATERELAVLKSHLESSLLGFETGDLDDAIREHQATARARRTAEAQALGWNPEVAAPRDEADPQREPELV
jgi:hypothetical protein